MNDLIIKNSQIITQLDTISISNHKIIFSKNHQYQEPITFHVADQSIFRLDLVVEENAEVEIIIQYDHLVAIEIPYELSINVKDNAHVKLIVISKLTDLKAHLKMDAFIERDASLKVIGGFINHQSVTDFNMYLNKEGANVWMHTVTLSSDQHDQKLNANIFHQAPNTFGDMKNVGIASKQGRITLNGVEKILKGMKHASAFQTLKGVILSDQSMVEVNPVLLIDEYDVKAGHGATVGKIDEEILYYLRSRGLTQAEAEKLFIHGYIKPLIDEIKDEGLKESVLFEMNHRI